MNVCKFCDRKYVYDKKKGSTKERCNTCYIAGNRRKRKTLAVELFGGGCQKCGYNTTDKALQFHHVDPAKKEFNLSVAHTIKWKRYIDELNKCVLLCSNCHAELHEKLWNIDIIKQIVLPQSVYDLVPETGRNEHRLVVVERKCLGCPGSFKVKLHSRRVFCSQECYRKNTRLVDRPSKEQLLEEIESMSWRALGRKYSVTDNAVRKWARSYGII